MSAEPASTHDDQRLSEVQAVFDRDVRPRLAAHLGGADITGVDADGVVQIEFTGACTSCAYRRNTIVGAIYPRLREVEGVRGVGSPGVAVSIREQHRVAALFDGYASRDNRDGDSQ